MFGTFAVPAHACFDPARVRAYLVAPNGDDNGPGTPDAPFATLARALTAMRAGDVHKTFVRDGRYHLTETLDLDQRDDGASILACPQAFPSVDAVAAGLDTLVRMTEVKNVTWQGFDFVGGHSDSGSVHLTRSVSVHLRENRFTRGDVAILLQTSTGCDIAHNTIRDADAAGIELKDDSDGNLITDNLIDGTRNIATHGGAIFLHGASGNQILRNQVQHSDGAGIVVANWDSDTINRDNLIAENAVVDVNRRSEDSGAIYLLGRSHVDMRTCVLDNLIDGTGAGGEVHTIGIYLDDSASGVAALGNRLRGIGTHAFEVHGGDAVTIEDNLLDLRSGNGNSALFQAAPADTGPSNTMQGNLFRRNLVAMDGSERAPFSFIDGGNPTIEANVYWIPGSWSAAAGQYGDAASFIDEKSSAPIDDLFRIWAGPAEKFCRTKH